MAFLYVFTFIPGLFVPYQASAIDLSSVAYKTGAILVEDPGWYIYTFDGEEVGNPAWETQPLDRLARIGLAEDKLTPNVLSIDKVWKLGNISNYYFIRDKIGLAGTLTYNYSILLTMEDTLGQVELLNITPAYRGESVEYMERNVMVNKGKQLYLDSYTLNPSGDMVHIGLGDRPADDHDIVTIRIFNATEHGFIRTVVWQEDFSGDTTPLLFGEGFGVRINGSEVSNINLAEFDTGDTIEVYIYGDAIVPEMKYLWITASARIFPVSEINYYDDPVYKLKGVCYPGKFKVEVWANEII